MVDLTVNEFVKDLFLYKEVKVYDENTWRPYCHVKDFARLMLFLLKKKHNLSGEVFNVGIIKIILQKNHIGSSFKENKKGKILFIKGEMILEIIG